MKTARILPLCVVLACLIAVPKAAADGWSLLGGSSTSTADTKKTAAKTAKKEPSTLDKLGTGTKHFFTRVGDTLTMKKKPAPKPRSINPYVSSTNSSNSDSQKKSWFSSWLQPEKPKERMTPTDWIGQERMDW